MINSGDKISVLIVDDSKIVRCALRIIFEESNEFDVVGEATTGNEAVKMALALRPRLVTMDLDMPDGNGLEAIEQIMATGPTRIMVVTGVPRFEGMDASFEALSRGALELIPKPTAWPGTEYEKNTILTIARRLSTVPVLFHPKAAREKRKAGQTALKKSPKKTAGSIIAIGASTGGPSVLRNIIESLPADLPVPVVIVQHLTDVFSNGFIQWLSTKSKLAVQEALPGTQLLPGTVFVGTRGAHVVVSSRGWIKASHEPPRNGHCPSVDILFESVAREFGSSGIGVLLTGMGRDGASGLWEIFKAGGTTVAQDEPSSTVFGMPKAAIELGAAQKVMPGQDIASFLIAATKENSQSSGESVD